MLITAETIIKVAAVITALSVIGGVVWSIVRMVIRDRKQSEIIKDMQEEQLIICKGLKGALQGLIESGCNGPCREALSLLDEHLIQRAHNPDLK